MTKLTNLLNNLKDR